METISRTAKIFGSGIIVCASAIIWGIYAEDRSLPRTMLLIGLIIIIASAFSKALYISVPAFIKKPFRLAAGGVCLYFIGALIGDESPDASYLLTTTGTILIGIGAAWSAYSISQNE